MNEADGKHIVVVDGKRASGTFESKADADAEADKRRKQLQETQGAAKPSTVTVKQNING